MKENGSPCYAFIALQKQQCLNKGVCVCGGGGAGGSSEISDLCPVALSRFILRGILCTGVGWVLLIFIDMYYS